MAELPACEAQASIQEFGSTPLGVPRNGHRVFQHRLSGVSPIFGTRAPGPLFSFSKTRWGNGRARNIMRSTFLSPKEYRDFAAQCLRWASRAKREEHKNIMLQMADHWVQTARRRLRSIGRAFGVEADPAKRRSAKAVTGRFQGCESMSSFLPAVCGSDFLCRNQ